MTADTVSGVVYMDTSGIMMDIRRRGKFVYVFVFRQRYHYLRLIEYKQYNESGKNNVRSVSNILITHESTDKNRTDTFKQNLR